VSAAKPKRPKRSPKRLRGDALRAHALEVQRRLVDEYPEAHCELDHRDPFELAVATVLSAQCTDKRVNMVTPEFFRRWPDAAALASAPLEEIEDVIRSTGFYRNKARSLSGLASGLVEKHGGEVPGTMDELVALPGIGRKTANVVLGNAFGRNEGIVVDTHVARLSARFGFTRETDAVRIEQALLPLFPRDSWTRLSHLMIWHGRRVCDARKPRCNDCVLADICPSADL
jgi:endonuclease III